jgi:hypothetical protein
MARTVIISTTLYLWLMRPRDNGSAAPVRTFTGDKMELLDTFFAMPNLANTSIQEKWGSMVQKSIPDTVFDVYKFSRFWAHSHPEGEDPPRGLVVDVEMRARFTRSLTTELSNTWGCRRAP